VQDNSSRFSCSVFVHSSAFSQLIRCHELRTRAVCASNSCWQKCWHELMLLFQLCAGSVWLNKAASVYRIMDEYDLLWLWSVWWTDRVSGSVYSTGCVPVCDVGVLLVFGANITTEDSCFILWGLGCDHGKGGPRVGYWTLKNFGWLAVSIIYSYKCSGLLFSHIGNPSSCRALIVHADGSRGVRFLPPFVCVSVCVSTRYFKKWCIMITKIDIEIFHDESWTPVYSNVNVISN